MKIVITHLTRMQKGFICVAGVDLATGQHVRPVLRSQMRKELLARYGGPFDIGNIVELGWTKWIGTRPAMEDYLFHRTEAHAWAKCLPRLCGTCSSRWPDPSCRRFSARTCNRTARMPVPSSGPRRRVAGLLRPAEPAAPVAATP